MTRLRELRENRLMTQQQLAERAGINIITVSRLERGRHRPRFATVRRLAVALGVEPEQLVGTSGR